MAVPASAAEQTASTTTGQFRDSGEADWLPAFYIRAAELMVLEAGWSDIAAARPNKTALDSACRLLKSLGRRDVRPALIAPSPEDGILIEFVDGRRTAWFEALNTGEVLGVVDGEGPDEAPTVWDATKMSASDAVARLVTGLRRGVDA